jgi:hypothetical protein
MSGSTYLDLLTQAAGELNLNALGDDLSASPDLAQRLLDRLTWMVDSWNLKPTVVPWYQRQVFNLVAGQQSYLIGPNAPDWNAPRPIRLHPQASNLLLTNPPYGQGNNPVRLYLAVLTVEQWAYISTPLLQSAFPQALYLDRSVVTGSNLGQPYTASRIWVWYTPNVVNQIELFYWQALTVGNLNDPVNAAPGYFRAMFLNLAVEIAPGFGITPNAITLRNAADSLGDIKELNAPDMRMRVDPGMPNTPGAHYLTKAQFLSGEF